MSPFANLSDPMDSALTKALPERLVRFRKVEGLTQVQIAQKLGISQSTYALYESGARNVSLAMLSQIADALNIGADELLGIDAAKSKRGPASQLEKRVEAIKQLPAPRQKEILKVVDALLAQSA